MIAYIKMDITTLCSQGVSTLNDMGLRPPLAYIYIYNIDRHSLKLRTPCVLKFGSGELNQKLIN